MSCEALKGAAESAKKAVIEALNSDMETNTLSELWRHYLGLRSIAESHKHSAERRAADLPQLNDNITFNSDGLITGGLGNDHIQFDLGGETPCVAAGAVDYSFNLGGNDLTFNTDDAVTFGELPKEE